MLKNAQRYEHTDKWVFADIFGETFEHIIFLRLSAKTKKFKNVSFKYSLFDGAYLKDCRFENCNFTGCQFINSNLTGSRFRGCKFNYTTFRFTEIDSEILEYGFPSQENLKLKFARSLRLNYQQIGDAKSANKAVLLELAATEEHHKKAWKSKESYYRNKYSGKKRVWAFLDWFEFKLLDLMWGNGESLVKLFKTFLFLLFATSLAHVYFVGDYTQIKEYLDAMLHSLPTFFGLTVPEEFPVFLKTLIYIIRLVMFAFLMAIVIKRFGRR